MGHKKMFFMFMRSREKYQRYIAELLEEENQAGKRRVVPDKIFITVGHHMKAKDLG